MNEQTLRKCEIKEVLVESSLLKSCLEKFSELEDRVGSAQMESVQGKYQYFLRKFQKITEEHQKYRELYENITRQVEDSPQILDEDRSIEFIKKVMEETQQKFNLLQAEIESLKKQKQKNQLEMVQLKEILLKKKGEYFQLERRQEEIKNQHQSEIALRRNKEQLKTMFKIRQEKKVQMKEGNSIQPLAKCNLNASFAERKVLNELEAINRLKEEFLAEVGLTLQDCYKDQERYLDLKSRQNKLISKRIRYLGSRSNLRSLGSYEPQDNALEIFNMVSNYDRELQSFMMLSQWEILDLIVEKNKVKQVLNLMEREKKDLIQGYSKIKYSKIKSN